MILFLRGYTVTESSVYLNPILQETNLMVQNGILEMVTDLLITLFSTLLQSLIPACTSESANVHSISMEVVFLLVSHQLQHS